MAISGMLIWSLGDGPPAVLGHEPLDESLLDDTKGGIEKVFAEQLGKSEEGVAVEVLRKGVHPRGVGEGHVDDFSVHGVGCHGGRLEII